MGQRRMALLPLCLRHRPASSVRTDHHHRCVLLVAARGSGQICLDADTFDIHEGQAQFRMLTGGSFGHHLRELRITKACSLLHGTALSITQIAEQCGFESVYSFSRTFKTGIGLGASPMATPRIFQGGMGVPPV